MERADIRTRPEAAAGKLHGTGEGRAQADLPARAVRHPNAWREWQERRPLRLMLGLAASLGMGLVLVNAPLRWDPERPPFFVAVPGEVIEAEALQMVSIPAPEPPPPEAPRADEAVAAVVEQDLLWHDPVAVEDPPAGVAAGRQASAAAGATPARLAPSPVAEASTLRVAVSRQNLTLPTTLSGRPEVDQPPQLRGETIDVAYPEEARRQAIEGRVVLEFVVETDGRAYGIEVVHSLHPACDLAAVEAVREARFIPGRHGGGAVPAMAALSIHFVLQG